MYMDNRDDQNDLFQEIVFQAWKSYNNFEGKSEFSTWLYRIAINTAMVYLKKEKKRSSITTIHPLENLDIKQETYNEEVDADLHLMYTCIQKLNPIDKALIFYFLENYSGKQMAEQLGISEANTRVKLNRAKLRLKELIGKTKT